LKDFLAQVIAGEHLTRNQARDAFTRVMRGEVEPIMLGAFLAALAAKGEQISELVGAAEAMRAAATPVRCGRPCLCTCGTGGDGISTFNVSTTAAIIAAAAGVVVAKHGNRTNTRVSGSAECLAALGVNIEADVSVLERCLEELGIAFLYAPKLHPAMMYAAPVRKAVGVRTVFNLLGPMCNPAGAARQVLGVSRPEHLELVAGALKELGSERVWVVHGHDGLCDITITGPTEVAELHAGAIRRITIRPEDAGLPVAPLGDLMVKTPVESAATILGILHGQPGPPRDHALLNTAAALVVYGIADDLSSAISVAQESIDTGKALGKLRSLVEYSNQ
jgi:anthranilate phosphoribosyltransferase